MKRSSFLFAVILGASVIGTTARAQFTSNPMVEKTTNTTALVPIGNGFGVAILGYGLPEYNPPPPSGFSSNFLYFASVLGQPAASDATVANDVYQFYVVGSDFDGQDATHRHTDFFTLKVTAPTSDPSTLTIERTWLARIETNNTLAVQAGSFAACGITTNGTAVLRADTSSSPSGLGNEQAMFVFDPNANTTVVITQLANNAAISTIITQSAGATLKIGSVGKNKGLLAGNGFSFSQYVARADITASSPTTLPHGQALFQDNDRSAMGINDAARVLAWWKKSAEDTAISCGDVCTHLGVFYYDDGGTSITPNLSSPHTAGSNDFVFGSTTGTDCSDGTHSMVTTNAIDYFGATAFNGPQQISINDAGELAFPVAINCWVNNGYSNSTRCATVTGILFKDADVGTFRKVVDTTDTSLFGPAIIPGPGEGWGETNNLVSPAALDNKGNVFFEASLTNFVAGGTNISDVAVYQSRPTSYPGPTSWTTRILLREGNQFVEPTSGNTIRIVNLPLKNDGGGTGVANVPRAFGANAINRTPLPGSGNPLGGVIVCASVTNLQAKLRYDALLYIAPLPPTKPPFQITSITRSGDNVNLVWNGRTGTNVVQMATGGDFVTNNFADLSSLLCSADGTTNYTHTGGATGTPNRYYRVKLLPIQ